MLTREINVELVKRIGDLVELVGSSESASSEFKASLLKDVIQDVKVLKKSMNNDSFPDHAYAHEKAMLVAEHAKECMGVRTGMNPNFGSNSHWMRQAHTSLMNVVPGCRHSL